MVGVGSWIETAKLVKEFGVTIAMVALLVWLIVYFSRVFINHFVNHISSVLTQISTATSKLSENAEKLADKIEMHEEKADMRGKFVKDEHESMLNSLRQVEQALGRINGYKS